MECFLCKSFSDNSRFIPKREKIKPFSPEIWFMCEKFLNARKHNNHKYSDVVLPASWDDGVIGYHSSCYKEFHVKKKYLIHESSAPSTALLTSTVEGNDSSPASTSYLDVQMNPTPSTSRDASINTFLKNEVASSAFDSTATHGNTTVKCTGDTSMEDDEYNDDAVTVQRLTDIPSAGKCFFCDKNVKTVKGRKLFCRKIKNKVPWLRNIKKYATELNDVNMLQKIASVKNLTDVDLTYHGHCHLDYYSKYKTHKTRPETQRWSTTRDCHRIARDQLIEYIERVVIDNIRVLSLAHVRNRFIQLLQELYEVRDMEHNMMLSTSQIKDHIQSRLKNKIKFITLGRKLYIISAAMDIDSINDEEISELIFEQEAEDFAMKYRANILKFKKNTIPEYVDCEGLKKDECEVPNWLRLFWTTALGGVDNRCNDRVQRLASCFSQDSIYSITRGDIKPAAGH